MFLRVLPRPPRTAAAAGAALLEHPLACCAAAKGTSLLAGVCGRNSAASGARPASKSWAWATAMGHCSSVRGACLAAVAAGEQSAGARGCRARALSATVATKGWWRHR
jgi:hypothetical protein